MAPPKRFHLGSIRVHSLLDIDSAPDGPGLYAWYHLFEPSPLSWKPRLEGREDKGASAFRQLLQRQTGRYASQSLGVHARGTFHTHWSGQLESASDQRWQAQLGEVGMEEREADASLPFLHRVIKDARLRAVLVGLLETATPVFSSPLYIGVATQLQKRLRQHVHQLYTLHEARSSLERFGEELSTPEATFAQRVAERGFALDDLRVYTLAIDDVIEHDLSDKQLRVAAEAAEWLLNRWHKPLLGRR